MKRAFFVNKNTVFRRVSGWVPIKRVLRISTGVELTEGCILRGSKNRKPRLLSRLDDALVKLLRLVLAAAPPLDAAGFLILEENEIFFRQAKKKLSIFSAKQN